MRVGHPTRAQKNASVVYVGAKSVVYVGAKSVVYVGAKSVVYVVYVGAKSVVYVVYVVYVYRKHVLRALRVFHP